MRESALEQDSNQLAEAMGWIRSKGKGRNGISDQIYLKCGRGFVVEFKTKKGTESDAQDLEGDICKAHGVPRYVVRNLIEFRRALLIEEAKFTSEDLAHMEV